MTGKTIEREISPEQFIHEGMPLIGFHTAKALWETRQKVSFINTVTEKYHKGRNIQGSEWIPVDRIDQDFEELHPDKEELIVTYCGGYTCPSSTQAAKKLKEMGYNHVLVYPGGLPEWEEHAMPVEESDECACDI